MEVEVEIEEVEGKRGRSGGGGNKWWREGKEMLISLLDQAKPPFSPSLRTPRPLVMWPDTTEDIQSQLSSVPQQQCV